MMVLCFSMQGEDIIKHTNGKCHVFTFQYACKSMTLLNILMSSVSNSEVVAYYISVTQHMPHNKVSGTITQVTLNTINKCSRDESTTNLGFFTRPLLRLKIGIVRSGQDENSPRTQGKGLCQTYFDTPNQSHSWMQILINQPQPSGRDCTRSILLTKSENRCILVHLSSINC